STSGCEREPAGADLAITQWISAAEPCQIRPSLLSFLQRTAYIQQLAAKKFRNFRSDITLRQHGFANELIAAIYYGSQSFSIALCEVIYFGRKSRVGRNALDPSAAAAPPVPPASAEPYLILNVDR
ncbi:MAG TPA: hypothetical protein VF182_18790, partial [Candidatus Binatia bacterium]